MASQRSFGHLSIGASLEAGPVIPGLESFPIEGARKVNEYAFYHRASGTLIVTDLVFHILEPKGFMSWLVFRFVANALGGVKQSRLWRSVTKDREAAGRSVDRLLSLDFDRLVVAHGGVVETGGREALAEATGWMRGSVRRALPAQAG